nr:hypothetical protein [Tanacetum cinerariifolium]
MRPPAFSRIFLTALLLRFLQGCVGLLVLLVAGSQLFVKSGQLFVEGQHLLAGFHLRCHVHGKVEHLRHLALCVADGLEGDVVVAALQGARAVEVGPGFGFRVVERLTRFIHPVKEFIEALPFKFGNYLSNGAAQRGARRKQPLIFGIDVVV